MEEGVRKGCNWWRRGCVGEFSSIRALARLVLALTLNVLLPFSLSPPQDPFAIHIDDQPDLKDLYGKQAVEAGASLVALIALSLPTRRPLTQRALAWSLAQIPTTAT